MQKCAFCTSQQGKSSIKVLAPAEISQVIRQEARIRNKQNKSGLLRKTKMKNFKKLVLASAVLATSTGVFAMEALQDDVMSDTTGQAGLTITTNNTSITANAIRYYDSNGTTGAAAAYGPLSTTIFLTDTGTSGGVALPGPCGGVTLSTCVGNFTVGGSVNINGFQLTEGSSTTTIDVGSTGTTAADKSGLLVGATANNLNVVLGGISLDNGDELNGTLTAGTVGHQTNGATYTGGFLTGGTDIGGIALTGIKLPKSLILITGGAVDLGTNSGLTITNLIPITDLSLTAYYYNTEKQNYTAGVGFTASGGANDGIVTLPINLIGVLTGPIEIAVGNAPASAYSTTVGEGLQVLMTGTKITAVDLGGEGANIAGIGGTAGSGIQIAGSNVGSVGILGLTVGSQLLNISGH
jgi:hypothetical protein